MGHFITKDEILAAYKCYNDISVFVFDRRILKTCDESDIPREKFFENKKDNCSCLKVGNFKCLLEFYCYKDVAESIDNTVMCSCCPNKQGNFFDMDDNDYLLEFNDDLIQGEYEPLKKARICVACVMLMKKYYDALVFYKNYKNGNATKQEDKENFISNFVDSFAVYYCNTDNFDSLSGKKHIKDTAIDLLEDTLKFKNGKMKQNCYGNDFLS